MTPAFLPRGPSDLDVVADDGGHVLRTRSVVRDLSREMAMAAALEESEHRFEQLFAKAPAGIALIDPKGKIQECNVALGRLIGREPQALRQEIGRASGWERGSQ